MIGNTEIDFITGMFPTPLSEVLVKSQLLKNVFQLLKVHMYEMIYVSSIHTSILDGAH